MDFAKVRVVRAPGERNGCTVLRVEVSSDEGETWRQLPLARTDDGVALRTGGGQITRVDAPIAVADFLGGTVELDRVATA